MRKRTQAREFALQILYQHEMNPASFEETVADFWKQHENIPMEVQQFSRLIAEGTLEHVKEIDEVITRAAQNWQLHRMAVIDRNILRLATFELLFAEDIPAKVAINEAVNMAKKFSQQDSGKFVNGILDKISHSEKKSLNKES